MFDGLTIICPIEDFTQWRRAVPISLKVSVDTFGSGEIATKKRGETTITTHRAKWETFDVIIKQVTYCKGKELYYLTLRGSLHKNHYGGKNYLPFTWQQLQGQINHICQTLFIDPSQAQISGLEIGVNVCTPFPVTPFLMQNVISYKGNSFNRYKKDAAGVCLGIHCDLSQYEVKVYDKGKQNQLPNNLMRFELKYFKMQTLNRRGIKYLSDLQNFTKVNSLQTLLFKAWKEVLIFDVLHPVKKLPVKQREIDLLIEGQNPKFWERLKENETSDRFKYVRTTFKILVAKYGNNWQSLVLELIINEWKTLCHFYPILPIGKTALLPDLTIKIKGKNGENILTHEKRYCLTCGRELHPEQQKESKYCSAKRVGEKQAHQCRNHNSNPRNNFKKKIDTITARGVLFDIMPYFTKPNFLPMPVSLCVRKN